MDRLTNSGTREAKTSVTIKEIIEKLAKYEDTGLTSEEIHEMDKEYQRMCEELAALKNKGTGKIAGVAMQEVFEKLIAEFNRRIDIQLRIIVGLNDESQRYGFIKSLEAYQQSKMIVEQAAEKYNNGWISCSERLPEKDGFYLATLDGEIVGENKPFTGLAEFENGRWVDDEEDYQCVLAWQSLPESYQLKGE